MSEYQQPLADYLPPRQREALRALFLEYEVSGVTCRYWKNRPPWRVEWRDCPDSFFLIPVRGKVRVIMKGGAFVLGPGQVLMLPEHTHHALEIAEGTPQLHQFSLHASIHDRWGQPLLARLSDVVGAIEISDDRNGLLKALASLLRHDSEAGPLMGEMVLKHLLAGQLSGGLRLAPRPTAGDPRMRVALQLMHQKMASPALSVETLAADVGVSPVHLRNLFRRETGSSPRRFLIQLRLRHAARLLRHSQAEVKEIAAASGFASDHYFHLAFRRNFGWTPSEYRRRMRTEV